MRMLLGVDDPGRREILHNALCDALAPLTVVQRGMVIAEFTADLLWHPLDQAVATLVDRLMPVDDEERRR